MIQVKKFSDTRLDYFCSYCGEPAVTRDHVPSKVLLDEPFPENIPNVPCCLKCNQNFSLDEEYFACLIECAANGTTDISKLKREKIKGILSHSRLLHNKLKNAMKLEGDKIVFEPDVRRLKKIILKLARGHAKFENSEPQWEEPLSFFVKPLVAMSEDEIQSFFLIKSHGLLPEVGSRSLQRLIISNIGEVQPYWIEVQPEKYRYLISFDSGNIQVKIIIGEYLACQVIWE
jgi:hypothetical protein